MHSIGDVLIYVDKFGKNYFEEWYLTKLDIESQELVRQAIKQQLLVRGRNLIDTLWLKSVYPDLFQLRIRKSRKPQRIKILLRIYLCFDDDNQIVLLSGYNKGIDTSRVVQSNEIERARRLLNDWREGNGRTENASPLFS
ncbi:MAG: Phage derived protein Gp49-like [Actinomycetota bacterium]